MNSYICEARIIERITTYILNSGLTTFAGIKVASNAGDAIGQKLVDLNMLAFNARYRAIEPIQVYHHITRAATNVQVAKSLACLMTQCAELPNVAANPTYAALVELDHKLAQAIVRALPEYDGITP